MVKKTDQIRARLRSSLHQFRYSLSFVDALPQMTFLGLVVGFFTGLIIIAFRLAFEIPLGWMLDGNTDNFEGLPPQNRMFFIVTGIALIYGLVRFAGATRSQVSVSHVLDRLYHFQGHMPLSNWIVQFFAGVISIISGLSVGREGPVVHLGAGAASRMSLWLRLPHNSRYTLIGCGAAAAISASFDTPLAGVIFAMEVILMEFSAVGLVPIILASVTGAAMSQAVFGNSATIAINYSDYQGLNELPFMICSGLVIAMAASLFIKLHITAVRCHNWPLSVRFALAAFLMSGAAWYVPEVMGLGYDTLNAALQGHLTIQTLLMVATFKLVVTAVIIGLGVPGGIIGPTLVIGACIGGVLGYTVHALYASPVADIGFYVILGMTGMMGAVLNAPMAALVAVLELSYNPNMIFPSMLVIVIGSLLTRSVFKLDGLFVEQLKATNRVLQVNPAEEALKRAGLAEVLQANLVYANRTVDYEQAKSLLTKKPAWVMLDFKEHETKDKVALNAADLSKYLSEASVEILALEQDIDLLTIPGRRLVLSPIHETASLWEALTAIRSTNTDGLYVARQNSPLATAIRGILTEENIRNYYQA